MAEMAGGGIKGAFRRKCANSAALGDSPADTKCQFGGISRASRQSFQRKYCKICEFCELRQ